MIECVIEMAEFADIQMMQNLRYLDDRVRGITMLDHTLTHAHTHTHTHTHTLTHAHTHKHT